MFSGYLGNFHNQKKTNQKPNDRESTEEKNKKEWFGRDLNKN